MISYDDLTYNKALLVGNAYCFISEAEILNDSSWEYMIAGNRFDYKVAPTNACASARFGLPVWLFEIAELVYNNLDVAQARGFPEELFKAVPVGISLDRVPMRIRARLISSIIQANPYIKCRDALIIARHAAECGDDRATFRLKYERARLADSEAIPVVIHDAIVSPCIADAARFAVHAILEHTEQLGADLTAQQRLHDLWAGVRDALLTAIYQAKHANQQATDPENES